MDERVWQVGDEIAFLAWNVRRRGGRDPGTMTASSGLRTQVTRDAIWFETGQGSEDDGTILLRRLPFTALQPGGG